MNGMEKEIKMSTIELEILETFTRDNVLNLEDVQFALTHLVIHVIENNQYIKDLEKEIVELRDFKKETTEFYRCLEEKIIKLKNK